MHQEIYDEYVQEILTLDDINRWASKKTITSKVLNPKRTQERKVLAAIKDKEVQEGDKIYTYFKSDDSVGLAENFDGDHSEDKMFQKLFNTSKVFAGVIDKKIFINYKLKGNKALLQKRFMV